jgi:hypothetical protein
MEREREEGGELTGEGEGRRVVAEAVAGKEVPGATFL